MNIPNRDPLKWFILTIFTLGIAGQVYIFLNFRDMELLRDKNNKPIKIPNPLLMAIITILQFTWPLVLAVKHYKLRELLQEEEKVMVPWKIVVLWLLSPLIIPLYWLIPAFFDWQNVMNEFSK